MSELRAGHRGAGRPCSTATPLPAAPGTQKYRHQSGLEKPKRGEWRALPGQDAVIPVQHDTGDEGLQKASPAPFGAGSGAMPGLCHTWQAVDGRCRLQCTTWLQSPYRAGTADTQRQSCSQSLSLHPQMPALEMQGQSRQIPLLQLEEGMGVEILPTGGSAEHSPAPQDRIACTAWGWVLGELALSSHPTAQQLHSR